MKSIEMVAKTLDDTGHFGGWNLDISWHRVSLTFTNEPPSHRRQCAHVAASRQRVPRGPGQPSRRQQNYRYPIPDILESLGTLAGDAGNHREAGRLSGAAHAIRERMGAARFKIYDAGHEASAAAL